MFTCTPLFLPYSIAFCIASTCDFDAPCGIATSKALSYDFGQFCRNLLHLLYVLELVWQKYTNVHGFSFLC